MSDQPTQNNPQQFHVDLNELRKNGLYIAVPMYGGQCAGTFSKAMCHLTGWLAAHGIPHSLRFLFNESLITRARNYTADNFLNDRYERDIRHEDGTTTKEVVPFSHMLFIDSDINFGIEQVIQMFSMMTDDSPYDILCGLYPKKNISWEKIKEAVDKGFADDDPNILADFVGDFVVNMPPNSPGFRINEPTEIMEAGTGFMMIRRRTFEKFAETYPENWYTPDHIRSEDHDGSRKIMMFFQAEIDNKLGNIRSEMRDFLEANPNATATELQEFILNVGHNSKGEPYSTRYLSEDYYFCQKARKAGMKVWMLPWINLGHYGSIEFTGKIAAMAAAGVSITADEKLLAKYKKKNANK